MRLVVVISPLPLWKINVSDPKYAATGSVSVIHAAFLRPLPFSQIR